MKIGESLFRKNTNSSLSVKIQEELQLEAANEDHKLLRSITREAITNGMELIDFGLQLGCPPSIAPQKLHDHPRSLEMASYMLAAEWWDSSGNSREEKYGVLLDTVRSMGKKFTAERLYKLVLEKRSAHQSREHTPITPPCSQHLEVNPCAFIVPNWLDGTARPHLAICNEVDTRNGNSFNIVEIPDHDEEERVNSINREGNNSEENGEIQETSLREAPSVVRVGSNDDEAKGLDDVFEEARVKTALANDIDVFDTIETGSYEVEANTSGHAGKARDREYKLDVEGSGSDDAQDLEDPAEGKAASTVNVDHQAHSECHGVDCDPFHRETITPNAVKLINTQKEPFENNKSRWKHEGKFNELELDEYEHSDVSRDKKASPGSGLFDLFRTSGNNSSPTPESHSKINLDDPDVVYHLLPEVHISNGLSYEAKAQRPVNDVTHVEMYRNTNIVDETNCDQKLNQRSDHTKIKPLETGNQTNVMNAQTDTVNSQTNAVSGQIGAGSGQTGAGNSQAGTVNSQTGVVKNVTNIVSDQTGVNTETIVVKDPTCRLNSQTDTASVQTGIDVICRQG